MTYHCRPRSVGENTALWTNHTWIIPGRCGKPTAFAVNGRLSGRFRGMSEGGASGAPGSGCNGADTGGVFFREKSLQSFLRVGKLSRVVIEARRAFLWERSGKPWTAVWICIG